MAFCDSSKLVSQLYDIGWQNGKIGPRRSDMHDDHANPAVIEQGKGSMPLTDTPQGAGHHWISRANPTSSGFVIEGLPVLASGHHAPARTRANDPLDSAIEQLTRGVWTQRR